MASPQPRLTLAAATTADLRRVHSPAREPNAGQEGELFNTDWNSSAWVPSSFERATQCHVGVGTDRRARSPVGVNGGRVVSPKGGRAEAWHAWADSLREGSPA